jgi:hypothetical protein
MTEQELGTQLAATLIVLAIVAVVAAIVALASRGGVSWPGYPSMPPRTPGSYPQLNGWQWGPHGWEYVTQSPPSRLWPSTVVVHRPPQRPTPTRVPPIATTVPRCTAGPVVLRPRRHLSGTGSTSMKHRISRRP